MPVRYFKDGPPGLALYRSAHGDDVDRAIAGEAYFDRRTMDWADAGLHRGWSIFIGEFDRITPEEAAAIEARIRDEAVIGRPQLTPEDAAFLEARGITVTIDGTTITIDTDLDDAAQ